MRFDEYLKKFRKVQKKILNFIEEEEDVEVHFENLKRVLINIKIQNNFQDNKMILKLILAISDNYRRRLVFFDKIEKILMIFKDEIKNLSNQEIFNIFGKNKRILLFLIEQKLFVIDNIIFKKMKNKNRDFNYIQYFGPELKSGIERQNQKSNKKHINDQYKHYKEDISANDQEGFYEKRRKGENDEYICQLIQNDSIVDFIVYVNQTNISLNSIIPKSIFETNLFILENLNNTSLINYAAFFGSIQIFRYLISNDAKITRSIWLYVIHGAYNDLVHYLEENKIEPDDSSFQLCYKEAVKCHHNPIAEILLKQKEIDVNLPSVFQSAEDYFVEFKECDFWKEEKIKTPLILAVEKGNIEITRMLLKKN